MALTLLKPTKHYVVKALKAYPKKLDMKEFIQETKFPIDSEIAGSFYTQMKLNIPIYLGKYEIEFFGYKAELRQAKNKILKAMKKNFGEAEGTAWWIYNNKKYQEFLSSHASDTKKKAYPALKTGRGHGKEEHILILPQLYKHLLIMANTSKAFQIREYLFQLEHLVSCMIDYYKQLNRHESKLEISDLKMMLIENEKRAEEERKRAEERFQAIMARNDNLLEEVEDIGDNLQVVEERLDEVLPNNVSLTGVHPGEKEIIVISRFENVNPRISAEKPFLVYKGQIQSVEEVRKKHIADISEMRRERLNRPLRQSEIPQITELFRVGENGYIPNAKKTWSPFKRANRRYLRFSQKKSTMFALLNGWSIADLRTALEAKDRTDRN